MPPGQRGALLALGLNLGYEDGSDVPEVLSVCKTVLT